ncbi:hypothetical protein C8F04DRAFT_1148432, partial [Mycena alexandri]
MAQWTLASREWLILVLVIVFRDLWIISPAHYEYTIIDICNSNSSFICELAGISDVRQHIAKNCQSLTTGSSSTSILTTDDPFSLKRMSKSPFL